MTKLYQICKIIYSNSFFFLDLYAFSDVHLIFIGRIGLLCRLNSNNWRLEIRNYRLEIGNLFYNWQPYSISHLYSLINTILLISLKQIIKKCGLIQFFYLLFVIDRRLLRRYTPRNDNLAVIANVVKRSLN